MTDFERERSSSSLVQGLVPAPSETVLQNERFLEISPGEEVPELREYWNLILKRRWTVIACFVAVFLTVAIGTLKQRPVYEGKVTIEIDPEQPNVVNFREVVQVSQVDFDSYRETQFKIIQSRTLAERVIRDLQLYFYPEFYRSKSLFGLSESDPSKIPSSSDPDPPAPTSDAYRATVSNFLNNVDVSPVRRSNLVKVSFNSYDPVLAARVANQLAADYIDQNLQVKWDETVKASEWLSGQLVGLKAKLEKSEDALQTYAQRNNILYIADKQNLVNARLEQLQQEYTKAQGERFKAESLYSLVQAGKVQDLPGVLTNQLIQNLATKQAELEREYANLTYLVKPEYPKAIQLKRQIDTINKALDDQKMAIVQNIVDEYRAAVAREKYLAQAVEDQKRVVNDIAEKSIQYNILKREVDTNKQLYEGLLQRLKEAQVSAGLKASNIRVVDAAEVPKGPVKPRVMLNLALGVILGLGLGVGLAFLQEYLDNTFKTPEDVEHFLRLPSLGLLPSFSKNSNDLEEDEEDKLLPIASNDTERSTIATVQSDPIAMEAFRSLRTSILLSASPVPRLILITSALPGEGKTTTTVSLGMTLASLGSRVVIVDCDMRKPACHLTARVPNHPGFVKCLTGQIDLSEALLPVPGVPNLSLIPCGPIPPNPAEVLSSPITREMLQKLRSEFDYVLVDSPPVLSVADTRILATLTDAVVLVTRAHSTPYDVVRRARATLYGSGARILGVALNDVQMGNNGKDPYYYGYGYGQDSRDDDKSQANR
ncbi:MAG TPA: polysaccharide biosynthesis tyrosine autokinase [Terriglobia bacterium]|nr:polysaccharide biosynthesis tyrosine autokinase [Terriglobia bacterium]